MVSMRTPPLVLVVVLLGLAGHAGAQGLPVSCITVPSPEDLIEDVSQVPSDPDLDLNLNVRSPPKPSVSVPARLPAPGGTEPVVRPTECVIESFIGPIPLDVDPTDPTSDLPSPSPPPVPNGPPTVDPGDLGGQTGSNSGGGTGSNGTGGGSGSATGGGTGTTGSGGSDGTGGSGDGTGSTGSSGGSGNGTATSGGPGSSYGGAGSGSGASGLGAGTTGGSGGSSLTSSDTFSVTLTPATLRLRAGDSADVEVRLHVPSSLVPVHFTLAPTLDADGLTALLDPLVLVVPSGDVGTSTLRVSIPADAAPSAYDALVIVTRGDTGESATATLPIEVLPPGATDERPPVVPAPGPAQTEEGSGTVAAEGAALSPAALRALSPQGFATAGVVAGASSMGVGLYMLTRRETWRFAMLALLAGLLSGLLFDAKLRAKVLDTVRKRPGITYGELRRGSGAGRLPLVATLRSLEANRAIKTHRSGTSWSFTLPASAMPLSKRRM